MFPGPFSPLAYDLILRDGMGKGLRDAYTSIGAINYDEFDTPERPDLFHVFGGYPFNPLTLTRIFGARMPGASPELIDKAFFDDRAEVPPYEEQPWHTSPDNEAKLAASMGWAMSATDLPELLADRELAAKLRANRPNLSALTDAALIAHARSMVPFVQQTFENAMRVSTLSSLGPGALGAICEAIGDPTASIRLLAGIEVDSAAPSHAMWDLGRAAADSPEVAKAFDTAGADGVLEALRASGSAEAKAFLAKFDQFLYDFGSRAQGEYDLYASAWEVKPRIALAAIDLMRRSDASHSPASRNTASVEERDRVLADVRSKIAGDAETAGLFEAALGSARLFLAGRERAKTNCVRVIHEIRVTMRELGKRLVERGLITEVEQVFMLQDRELDQVRQTPDRFPPIIAERWAVYQSLWDLEPVFVVNGVAPTLSQMKRKGEAGATVQAGSVLQGAAGSGGKASGRARVVLDAADPVGLEPGDVLIAPQTDPSWVPLFVPASAVIVNVGAAGSHAMIVSRELGIPCVVSVADATAVIPDGAMVTVDGNAGTVTIDSLP